ncbi:IS701 family transposase [Streptomyces sp. NBC_01264]|uniref:IS701 family transposase n=1 Tax=Streptomyces sp. NBC_01264 TaxID=2903804 RepID=UPI0022577D31|nr:transposase [Streptomyces sp. NBC_01264]MCX4779700.1 transposase [Streptomyces sp. NBC_01264]
MTVTSLERLSTLSSRFVPDLVVGELCAELFASLPRSDQRRKGEVYLRGLLQAEGRKSIRNIAAYVGDRAAEQSLHHFVVSSTWDWGRVRAALARYLERALPPQAWVVQPVVISKAGTESVGVDRRFVPELGQMVNSQAAYGVWSVGEEQSCPVNWRLTLSRKWRDSIGPLSPNAGESELASTPLELVAGAVEELRGWVGRTRPVLLDVPDLDPAAVARRFEPSGTHFVAPARGSLRVRCVDAVLPGAANRELAAHQLLLMARTLRRPVSWRDPSTGRPRVSLVVTVRVELPNAPRPQLLFGEWSDPRGWPDQCWVTDMTQAHPGALLRLAKRARQVEADFTNVAQKVGLTDFGGRSFEGWHRHTTLASAAHAVRVLTQRAAEH